jgi:hypothetical protein
MALEVLNEIRAAEEAALETRRVAAAAAKESLKVAEQENAAYRERMIAEAKARSQQAVAAAQQASREQLDAQQAKRLSGLDALRSGAEGKLKRAAGVCVERILQ